MMAGGSFQGRRTPTAVDLAHSRDGRDPRSDKTIAMIQGGTPRQRVRCFPGTPRHVSARAVDEINYLAIDSELST